MMKGFLEPLFRVKFRMMLTREMSDHTGPDDLQYHCIVNV